MSYMLPVHSTRVRPVSACRHRTPCAWRSAGGGSRHRLPALRWSSCSQRKVLHVPFAQAAPEVQEAAAFTAKANGSTPAEENDKLQLTFRVATGIDQIDQAEWDEVATSSGEDNPFLSWAFLHALEASGSAVPDEGWAPQHITVRDQHGTLQGCCPLYLKGHSYGEYVFDSSWANYSHMMGQAYYPKLQACVPFSPVTGNRLLVRRGPWQDAVLRAMGETLIDIANQMGVSSLHLTFNTAHEWAELSSLGYMQRTGVQFHWENQGYPDFEAFLSQLKQTKRKNIRQERKSAAKQGLTIRRLSGAETTAAHWDRFYSFYQNTVDRKWGSAYLTRDFFHRLHSSMPDKTLLVIAEENGEMVAGALNLVGSHALYGRNWGCAAGKEYKNLHFELCYYQAIEEAIARKLPRVEAGAQGEHKLQRGYLPSYTYSSHYIRHPQVKRAVGTFLTRERMQMEHTWQALLLEGSPFKQETTHEQLVSKWRSYSSISSGSSSDDP